MSHIGFLLNNNSGTISWQDIDYLNNVPQFNINGDLVVPKSLILSKDAGEGIYIDPNSPSYTWRDIIGDVIPKTSGVGSPTLTTFFNNIRFYAYSVGEDGDTVFHIPHDYVPGTDIFIHLHWSHTGTSISGLLDLRYNFTYAKGHNQASFLPELSTKVTVPTPNIATIPQFIHRIDEIQLSTSGGLINVGTNISISSGTATLTSSSSLFAATDINKTIRIIGAGPAGSNLDTTIIGFTSATQVTIGTNASTTVTNQPNFRWRILDTNLIEPDGILAIHYDLDTLPTISGGSSNKVFFFHIDIHYQSTNIGTKQKTPNFYI